MAKAQYQLKKAVYDYFYNNAACAQLRTYLTKNSVLNIYADNAPQNADTPYLVYSLPSNNVNYTLGNGNMDYINLQISIYDDNTMLDDIIPIAAELEHVLDGYLFTLDAGYTCFYNVYQISFELFPEKEYVQIVQRYKVGIEYKVG